MSFISLSMQVNPSNSPKKFGRFRMYEKTFSVTSNVVMWERELAFALLKIRDVRTV